MTMICLEGSFYRIIAAAVALVSGVVPMAKINKGNIIEIIRMEE
ncbi:MAG: hypothetical protein Q8930_07820 [Bacillota bacterium]|nr:hypothetical protein [Bacillota bacterium]